MKIMITRVYTINYLLIRVIISLVEDKERESVVLIKKTYCCAHGFLRGEDPSPAFFKNIEEKRLIRKTNK